MEILYNRMVAVILCAVMILGASLAGAGSSLRTLRSQGEAVFVLGSSGGSGLQHDLLEIAAQSYNITVVARRYLPEADPGVSDVLQKRNALLSAATPREKCRAAGELTGAATSLRHVLSGMELSDQDRTLLQKCAVNIDSSLSLIAGSGYNEAAAAFNRTLGSFPANMLGPLTGVTPLELYE